MTPNNNGVELLGGIENNLKRILLSDHFPVSFLVNFLLYFYFFVFVFLFFLFVFSILIFFGLLASSLSWFIGNTTLFPTTVRKITIVHIKTYEKNFPFLMWLYEARVNEKESEIVRVKAFLSHLLFCKVWGNFPF